MKRVIRIMMLVLILVLGLTVAGCSSTPEPAPAPAPSPSPAPSPEPAPSAPQGFNVGNLAYDFQLQRLDGQAVTLSGLRGSLVMLNFWATWCGPCRVEMPFIQEVFEDDKWADQGLVILAVNIGETSSQVEEFMEHFGVSFPVLLDKDADVAKNYNIRGIPTTLFIDKNGIIKDKKVGAFLEEAELVGRLDNLMTASE
jgi:thiol-disulfide isomerase/thioredoxin